MINRRMVEYKGRIEARRRNGQWRLSGVLSVQTEMRRGVGAGVVLKGDGEGLCVLWTTQRSNGVGWAKRAVRQG